MKAKVKLPMASISRHTIDFIIWAVANYFAAYGLHLGILHAFSHDAPILGLWIIVLVVSVMVGWDERLSRKARLLHDEDSNAG